MPERALHATLEDLHRGLAAETSLDEDLREELRQAMEDIGRRLEAEGEELDRPLLERPLLERVRGLMERFETEHPNAAEAVGRVVRALARLGI